MTIEEIRIGLKKLRASYPSMQPIGEDVATAYTEQLIGFKWEDFAVASRLLVRTSKFFPAISELVTACEDATRDRLEREEHEARFGLFAVAAIKAGEDEIMRRGSPMHRMIVGPEHQRFVDMLEGRITLPEPEWMRGRV